MVAVKAHEADAYLRALPSKITALLFYGSDEGLIAERAQAACKTVAAGTKPAGEILRLDDLDLEQDPGRIAMELTTVSMFGGRRIVRASASRRLTTATVSPLLAAPLDGMLVIEAGNLKPDEGLRGLFEKSPTSAAIACYADNDRDIEGVLRAILSVYKLEIASDAKQALIARLGGDRIQTRAEIEKLALYCYGRARIEIADIEEITGDASELALDKVVTAVADGRPTAALTASERAVSGGESPQALIMAAQRYFQRLHRVRTAFESSGSMDIAIRTLRPPLHFKMRDDFIRHVKNWPSEKIHRALDRISFAQRLARSSTIDDALAADRLCMDLVRLAALPTRAN